MLGKKSMPKRGKQKEKIPELLTLREALSEKRHPQAPANKVSG